MRFPFVSGIVGSGPTSGHDGFEQATWWPVIVRELLEVSEQLGVGCGGAGKALGLAVRLEVSPDLSFAPIRFRKIPSRLRSYIRVGMGVGVRINFIGGGGKGGGVRDCPVRVP